MKSVCVSDILQAPFSLSAPYIRGIPFGLTAKRGDFATTESFEALSRMLQSGGTQAVVLYVNAWRRASHAAEIDFKSAGTPGDWETANLIDRIHQKGFRVLLMPRIGFLTGGRSRPARSLEEPERYSSQPGGLTLSYEQFLSHFARIAQETGCSFFSVGSGIRKGMNGRTQAEALIASVRACYDGFVVCEKNAGAPSAAFCDAVDFFCAREQPGRPMSAFRIAPASPAA